MIDCSNTRRATPPLMSNAAHFCCKQIRSIVSFVNKRLVNWIALFLLSFVVVAMAIGDGPDGTGFLVVLIMSVIAALYVGRRMFARRDRRMNV